MRCSRSSANGLRRAVALALTLAASIGCSPQAPALAPANTGAGASHELVVYAAASLGDVFRALAGAYEEQHPGTRVVLSFDASNLLRTRIEAGAAADVFAAADTENPERLARAGLAAGPPVSFAANALAVVVPVGNPAGIDDVFDLAHPDVRLVAAGEDVPITRYAVTLLERVGALPDAPRDFVARVMRNVASGEDNVRSVLTKVELGEADAGIVYRTDAARSARVKSIALPSGIDVRVTYAAVAIRRPTGARAPEPGTAFVTWLRGERAAATLARAGFERP